MIEAICSTRRVRADSKLCTFSVTVRNSRSSEAKSLLRASSRASVAAALSSCIVLAKSSAIIRRRKISESPRLSPRRRGLNRGDSEILRRLIMADDFASTMQELSAAATLAREEARSSDFASLLREFRTVTENVQSLESALTRRVEQIASIILPAHATEAAAQFQKIQEGLEAIRVSESVNHRLFDSLHEELLKY